MSRRRIAKRESSIKLGGYNSLLAEVSSLLEQARRGAARAVNYIMTATYWQIGKRIVEFELAGHRRADYRKAVMDRLSGDLSARFGRGFSRRAVYQMRSFYLAYPPNVQAPSAQMGVGHRMTKIVQSTIAQSRSPSGGLETVTFPLPWSHYVRLLSVDKPEARESYESEALRGGWTVRQLDRQISTRFYERTLLSKNKAAMLTKHNRRRREDAVSVEEEIKDPFVLEFLGLKDEYSEHELEEALILQLEQFLLELGGDFAFVGRQRRLRVGEAWYRIDLLFFHRRLRCLVVIDLKVGKFTHADAGAMHLYLNYAQANWTNHGENPPVGLILCTEKDTAVAHYALDNLRNKVLAAEYRMKLPDERRLEAEVQRTRRMLESRVARASGRV